VAQAAGAYRVERVVTISTILFDLDDTLTDDTSATEQAFRATAALAGERYNLEPDDLARAIRVNARDLWRASPTITYCRAVGISSWEGLCASFMGHDRHLTALRAWVPAYRQQAWSRALAHFGIHDLALVESLATTYMQQRLAYQVVFREVEAVLTTLRSRYKMGLITNGAPDLQRAKLATAKLASYFDVVIVSGEVGVGKPDPHIFSLALQGVGAGYEDAVMVGDSVSRDIVGAHNAGIKGVLVTRARPAQDNGSVADAEIQDLSHLATVLE